MRILGIESSADETAAAVIEDGYRLLSSEVASSLDLHRAYGGIVPEIAARSHIESILPVIDRALEIASTKWPEIDAIAVTRGPGLSGSLLIGLTTARTLAIARNKPLYGINHVQAHVYANFITETKLKGYMLPPEPPSFPFLALIVSGGHTQLVLFQNHSDYKLLGQTADDAVGEAFDKVAKVIGLPYPGGVSVSKAAEKGNPNLLSLPKAKLKNPYDFSFSGLKTAVLRATQEMCGKDYTFPSTQLAGLLSQSQKADIAASFQKVAVDTLVEAVAKAVEETTPVCVVIAGGVAANQELRGTLAQMLDVPLLLPDIKLCTDNAAMIACLGYYRSRFAKPDDPYSLDIDPGLSM